MITFFNRIGNSWIAKVICATLGVSMMAFWGLGGLSGGFSGDDHKAVTVGSDIITVDQINQQLNQERAKISALTGQNLSLQKAVELGLLDLVIQQLINEKVQQNMFNEIGLIASDDAVRKYVERNPIFQDNLGHFDANLFYAYMGQLKINQSQLSEKLKQELILQHLNHSLNKTAPQNSQIIADVASKQKEKRDVYGVLLLKNTVEVGTPDENTLKDYYEAYQEEFMNPEYRQIQLLTLLPSYFKGDKEQAYDKMYQTVQDLEDLLGEGLPLKEAAQKLNLASPDTLTVDITGQSKNLKETNNQLKDNPILQEVFTLVEGETSSIIDYKNGFLVAEVEKIFPAALKPYDKVKDQVKNLWKEEQQKEKLPQIVQKTIEQIKKTSNWGNLVPVHEVIEQTQSDKIPSELLSAIYAQKIGYKNAESYNVQDGSWLIVVNRVIQDNKSLSDKEKDEARRLYTQELMNAVQQTYMKNLNVQLNESSVNKFFLSYSKEQE